MQGVITDPTAGIIPGAHVKLVNNGTQATQETTANDQGFYRFNQLPAGNYSLTIDAPGFQTSTVAGIQVAADLPQSANATLQPGNIQSSVTVSASAIPALQTADASMSGTINTQAVLDLPSFGRDPYELVRTMPGIAGTGGRSGNGQTVVLGNTTGPGQSNLGIFQTENQVQVSSAGQRVEQNVYYIDGVNVNSLGWGGATVVTPNTESVQDMTVITADYDAADGRGSGAHIRTTTRSGTDQFHGSGVFVYQDPNFNAYNKWGGPNNAPPVRVQNNYRQYAASVGGPILKDKFFFFLSYEGLHNKTTTFGQGWATTPQFRQLMASVRGGTNVGRIFGSSNTAPRALAVLGGPSTTCSGVFHANAATLCRDVPGGLDLGSPGPGLAGTPYYANPNGSSTQIPFATGNGFDGIPDLQYVEYYLPSEQIGNQFNGRFDLALTSKDLIFASAYITHLNQVTSESSEAGAPGADVAFKPTDTAITLGYVRNVSSTIINELRGNVTRFSDNGLNDTGGINWGIPQLQVEGYPFGNIQVAGAIQGSDTPAILAQNTYEIRDTVTKVWGNHTIRVGGEYRWEQDNDNLLGSARPFYSFSGLWNLANNAPIYERVSANVNTGGSPTTARYFRDHIGAIFAQDDWHVAPSLTLNLGLRWEYFSPLTEARGQLENIFLAGPGSLPLVNSQIRHVDQLWNSNWKNFQPRIGFAFAPTAAHERFVVRGGFGMLYNRQNDNIFANSREDNPDFFGFNLCCGTAPSPFSFSSPFAGGSIQFVTGSGRSPASYPANACLATGVNPVTGTPNSSTTQCGVANIEVYGAWPNTPDAYTDIYSFETQTQIAKDLVFTLAYQGAISRHLIRLVNQNFLYATSAGNQSAPVYASYIPTPDVNASYNAMNAHIAKQFSRGFSADATYTWSKCIDMLSAEGPGSITNQTDPVHAQTSEYGPCDYDARHRFVASGLWTLPIFPHDKGWAHAILGGWQLGAILTAYSGFPWTPVTGNQSSVAAVTSAATISPTRPVAYFGNANPNGGSNQCFINGCEFGGTSPTSPIVGTKYFDISHSGPPGIGRNSFRGPGFFSTDASLAKTFGLPMLGEGAGLELRAYAFNVFNQLNLIPFPFADPVTHVEDANFGRPKGALAGRSIELQVRFTF
ncbi:MAG: TonB-dependent receptor [Acidobacteriaceae bacterium]|nr:TonB-dependent receptor [Acidobacteriaceae bacterium]